EGQRTIRPPAGEQSGLLQILDEERQLAQRRHQPVAVPLDMHTTGKCLRRRGKPLYRWLFTLRVRQKPGGRKPQGGDRHCRSYQRTVDYVMCRYGSIALAYLSATA